MRLLPILSLLCLATPALAVDHAPGTCYQKTVTVCVPKKPRVKVRKGPLVVVPQQTVIVVPPLVVPPIQVTITPIRTVVRNVPVPCNKPHVKDCRKEPKVVVGGYLALGVGVRDQYVQGNVGLQLEFPKARLGLRAFTALNYGVGFQALIYPYRSDRLKIHIVDPGVLVTGDPFSYTNNTDVPRRVDLLLGAGVQVKLICNLDLTVDWRVNIADPGMLARDGGVTITSGPRAGKFLEAGNVVGNSFSSSQVLLGLLLHL
jgi:hypothetical protein